MASKPAATGKYEYLLVLKILLKFNPSVTNFRSWFNSNCADILDSDEFLCPS
jgi:hypothetical protein